MNNAKAQLCFTSPPYADMRDYGGACLSVEHLSQFIAAAQKHCEFFGVNLGIKRADGAVVQYWQEYIAAAHKAGLKLLSWNVWARESPGSIGQQTACFPICHEFIFVYGRYVPELKSTVENIHGGERVIATNRRKDGAMSLPKRYNVRMRRPLGTVIMLDPVKDSGVHGAQFPVALPQEYIKAFGGDVYDPFVGSGTTIIAAEQLKRQCYAIEIEPRYVDVAVKRWQNLTGKKAKLVRGGKSVANKLSVK